MYVNLINIFKQNIIILTNFYSLKKHLKKINMKFITMLSLTKLF